MKKIVCSFMVLVFIFFAVSAVGVAADAGSGGQPTKVQKKNTAKSFTPWWQDKEFVKDIDLTKEQQEKIDSLTKTYPKANLERRKEARKISQELEKQLLAVTPIEQKILLEKKASLIALRNQMFGDLVAMKIGVHAILTESQRQKIAKLRPRLFSLRSNWMRPQRQHRGKRSPFAKPGSKIGPRQKTEEKTGK